MTWQDELRQLDEALAAGQLSAEDYRRQRDDLLSRSASMPSRRPPPPAPADAELGPPSGPQPVPPAGTLPGPGTPPGGQPTQAQQPPKFPPPQFQQPPQFPPPQFQQQSGPFPPPFRWDQAPPESPQVMGPLRDQPGPGQPGLGTKPGNGPGAKGPGSGPANGPGSGPRTGPLNGPGNGPGNGPLNGAGGSEDAEQTLVVPRTPRPGQPQPGGPGQGPGPSPVPPWQQHGDHGPLWGGAELPPPMDNTPGWFKQGPEVFDEAPGGSRAIRIFSVVGVVLLLIGISAGAYYFFRTDPDPAGSGGPTATATAATGQSPAASTQAPTTTAKPEGPPIAELPGTATDTARVKTFVDIEAIGYLTNQEIDAYRAAGAGASKLAISNSGDSRIIVLITQQADAAGAARTRDALNDLQLRFKLTQRPAAPGVLSAGIDNADPGPLRRAHYASGRYVVRVQVQGIERAEVDLLYDEVLGMQLDELPADA